MTSGQIHESYSAAVAVSNVSGSFAGLPFGTAKLLLVKVAFATAGPTLTLQSGATVQLGLHAVGTRIPITCTAITFGGGGTGEVVALA